jgi:hypothetical protein
MMERFNWKSLSGLQLGRFAEYFVKMEFTLYAADIYSPEIDDKGIDFIVRTGTNKYWEVQVKSLYKSQNFYMDKHKFDIEQPNLLVALVRFANGEQPVVYLLHAKLWQAPNRLFVGYDRKGYAEWGLQITKKNTELLFPYAFDKIIGTL